MKIRVSDYMERLNRTTKWWYWLGTYGNIPTQALWNSKANQRGIEWWYQAWASARPKALDMYAADRSTRVADCVGLDKYARWVRPDGTVPYDPNTDLNEQMLFDKAKRDGMKWGLVSQMPEVVGLAVWYRGHIGFYLGNNKVLEARGGQYGVVITQLDRRPWTHYFYNPFVDYEEDAMILSSTQNRNHPFVLVIQKFLVEYLKPRTIITGGLQGIIGPTTAQAINVFKKENGLPEDGAVDFRTTVKMIEVATSRMGNEDLTNELNKVKAELDREKARVSTLQHQLDNANTMVADKDKEIAAITSQYNVERGIVMQLQDTVSNLKRKAAQDADVIEVLQNRLAFEKEKEKQVTIDWKDASAGDLIIRALKLIFHVKENGDG